MSIENFHDIQPKGESNRLYSNYIFIMKSRISTFVFLFLLFACAETEEPLVENELEFEPQSVLVKTNATFLTNDIFDLINGFDFEVKSVNNAFYITELPGDRLEGILDDLNTRHYINDGVWKATGYLHAINGKIHVFTRFFDIRNRDNQRDWLSLMEKYQLRENFVFDHSGFMIHFKVPEGEEKRWVRHFQNLDFVEWAELNYYVQIVTH